MKKNHLNHRIRQIIKNRMLGFKTPEANAQLIVDVIIPLTNKGITISRATAIQEKFFPDLELKYLFRKEVMVSKAEAAGEEVG